MHKSAPSRCVNVRVKEGDTIELEEIQTKVLETKGHTQDSISLIADNKIFTVDALFLDEAGAGRDDLLGGDPALH